MKWLMAIAVIGACGGPQLAPGEQVCTSRPNALMTFLGVKGVVDTHCEIGQARRTPPAWWCATRADGLGICSIEPGPCEWFRGQHPDFTVGCQPAQLAVCASGACFANAASCAELEREQGRDGQGCVALRAGERVPPVVVRPPPPEPGDRERWCFEVRLDRTCENGRARCERARREAVDHGRAAEDCKRE